MMKRFGFGAAVVLSVTALALPVNAQFLPDSSPCDDEEDTYHALSGFCIEPEEPSVYATFPDESIMIGVSKHSGVDSSYLVQVFGIVPKDFFLLMELDASRVPVEYHSGDRELAEDYRQHITQGLDLVDRWSPDRFSGF